MPSCEVDHLVITATSLPHGADYVSRVLGVAPQVGGGHRRMGTHNLLVKLGEATYLEVIAPDPAAPKPDRPRWYDLDLLATDAPPRLATWVVRVNDIETALAASSIPLGRIEAMSRGQLNWQITIPEDGGMPLQGIAPTLIQWDNGHHPASQLDDVGCSLIRLQGFHPQAESIAVMLEALGFRGEFTAAPPPNHERPSLVAFVQTPAGVREMGAP